MSLRTLLLVAIVCAVAPVSCHADANTAPTGIRIALAGNDGKGMSNGMTISWTTQNATATSMVLYGLASGVHNMVRDSF